MLTLFTPHSSHLLVLQHTAMTLDLLLTLALVAVASVDASIPRSTCGAPDHTCGDGRCVPSYWVCDQFRDCVDGSDEVGCQPLSTSAEPEVTTTPRYTCANKYHTCGDGRCVPSYWVCDRFKDCVDGSDEVGCQPQKTTAHLTPSTTTTASTTHVSAPTVTTKMCAANQFQCTDRSCIPMSWECDREDDCGDNSDENSCAWTTTTTSATTTLSTSSPPKFVASGCGDNGMQIGTSGTFSSKNYPNSYTSNLNCKWTITVPTEKLVKLHFSPNFKIEGYSSTMCRYDHLTIYEGSQDAANQLNRLCQDTAPSPVVSKGNKVVVVFYSDESVAEMGFSLNWEAQVAPPVTIKPTTTPRTTQSSTRPATTTASSTSVQQSGCGGPMELTGNTGSFTSSNFGVGNYPAQSQCVWTISAPAGKIINLAFDSFDVESDTKCEFDYVAVYDGKDKYSPLIKALCGKNTPADLQSKGENLFIRFVSDEAVEEKGFKITYTVSEPPVTCRPNEFTCANGKCISASRRCDEVNDCGDGSDEICLNLNGCGVPSVTPKSGNGRIVGGREAVPHSWPWILSLRYRGSHNCGASLIHPQWVLTASHCFDDANKNPRYWSVAGGKHNTYDAGTVIGAEQVLLHENYDYKTTANDVALVKLKTPFTLDDKIKTACLPSKTLPPGYTCYAAGWGATRGTCCANRLKQIALPIIATSTCNERTWYNGDVLDGMFCAGYSLGGHDSCQGDSGGPLVCKVGNKWEQHGVTSWGIGCADPKKPGVFATITKYIPWITENMAKHP